MKVLTVQFAGAIFAIAMLVGGSQEFNGEKPCAKFQV
jgi:hypothetical protein